MKFRVWKRHASYEDEDIVYPLKKLRDKCTNTISTVVGLLPLFPEGSKEREVLINRVKAGCAAQSRQIGFTVWLFGNK